MQKQKPKPACRFFFEELSKSDFFIKENDENFLVTPTCAICKRLFGVGEVKGVEKRGRVTKIRITDLTAILNIYTNKAICGGSSEKFLAFVGNLRQGKKGNIIILVEEAEAVNELIRDGWIIKTATRAMERIELLRPLVNKEKWRKEEGKGNKEWMEKALEHYSIDDDKLDVLGNLAINAVKSVWQRYSKTAKELVLEVLEKDKRRRMEHAELMEELKKKGLREEWMEEVIDELIEEGRCYEPKVGVLKVVEE